MIPEFGLFSLIIALLFALLTTMIPFLIRVVPEWQWHRLTRSTVYGQCFFVLLSFLTLMFCFISNDFSVEYIAQNSNENLPIIYKLCAVWGAHEGSLLLWSLVLSLWMVAVLQFSKRLPQPIGETVLAILSGIQSGFLLILLQTSNPFSRILPFFPNQGADLNPLLQDPGFVLHPPFLYMGYVGFAVPFAFAITGMIMKEKSLPWVAWVRPWTLWAWAFLTVGITLGSWWAYYELGWGGWWFWDPVENASFMPWLVGAALVHAHLVSSQNAYFSAWGVLLALCAFILSLIGTFLVRSGVISSVHAFASDPMRGTYILCFLAIVIISSFSLYAFRERPQVTIQRSTFISKEALLILGNVILFVATLTILLGTLYPLFSQVVQNIRLSVGPPYFNIIFIPLMLPVLLLMAIAPHFRWRNDSFPLFWQRIKRMLGMFLVVLLGVVLIPKALSFSSLLGILLGSWVILGATFKLKGFSLKQAGMILAHFGLGVAVLGISLTTSLETEKELKIAVGDEIHVHGYDLYFAAIQDIHGPNYAGKKAHFTIKQNNKIICELFPEKRFFIPRNIPMSETAISPGLIKDFYVALGERLDSTNWSVRFYVKPFIRWIWLGGLMIALGAFMAGIIAFKEVGEL